ncbi:hypothetical protein IT396_03285 [Candidatus Nomurabacteria bacterium]|nr:hypothetical protein [Candidatus Nomurabacteria bacterium]
MASKIEQQVMASVGTIYIARQLVSGTALRIYVCLIALGLLARLVWVERVVENFMQSGVGNAHNFIASAVLNTELPVQIAFAALVIAGAWVSRDLARLSYSPRRFA